MWSNQKRINYDNSYSKDSENCWFAWTNGNNTVYTQTDEPETICDWTFSVPNEIAHKIDEVNSNTISSNGITYTRNRELDNNQLITSFYFTINTEGYRSGNKEFIIHQFRNRFQTNTFTHATYSSTHPLYHTFHIPQDIYYARHIQPSPTILPLDIYQIIT